MISYGFEITNTIPQGFLPELHSQAQTRDQVQRLMVQGLGLRAYRYILTIQNGQVSPRTPSLIPSQAVKLTKRGSQFCFFRCGGPVVCAFDQSTTSESLQWLDSLEVSSRWGPTFEHRANNFFNPGQFGSFRKQGTPTYNPKSWSEFSTGRHYP